MKTFREKNVAKIAGKMLATFKQQFAGIKVPKIQKLKCCGDLKSRIDWNISCFVSC